MSSDPIPTISVIMPVGRVDDDLRLQIEALRVQTYEEPWELVLSLNTDDARERERLEQLVQSADGPMVSIVDSSDLRSAAHARNVGAAHARSGRLAFCDGDDIADRDWLAAIVEGLGHHDAVGGHLDEELLAVPGQEDWRPPATPGDLPQFLGHPFLVSANMGVDRSHFEQAGGFDTSLIRGEDIALSWALLDNGADLAFWPAAIVYYRHRRGLRSMMQQHYLYGRGFSQLLSRRSLPGSSESSAGLAAIRPNGQAGTPIGVPYFLRRGSIAAGRLVGLIVERTSGSGSRA